MKHIIFLLIFLIPNILFSATPTIVINEFDFDPGETSNFDDDWLELFCVDDGNSGNGVDISSWYVGQFSDNSIVLMPSGSLTMASVDLSSTTYDDRYLIVHLSTSYKNSSLLYPSENDDTGDTDQSGFLDVYVYGSLSGTVGYAAISSKSGSGSELDPTNIIYDFAFWADLTAYTNFTTYYIHKDIKNVCMSNTNVIWVCAEQTNANITDGIDISSGLDKGLSISRISDGLDTDSKADWKMMSATPGSQNGIAAVFKAKVPISVSITNSFLGTKEPIIIPPNNITFKYTAEQDTLFTVTVYNMKGDQVAQIANHLDIVNSATTNSLGSFSWDGKGDNFKLVAPGIYMVVFEAIQDEYGFNYKKTFPVVVSGNLDGK